MTDEIKQAIQLLEENGYKITAPPKEIKDEYTFELAWKLYDKKIGCKAKLEKKWNSMSKKDRKADKSQNRRCFNTKLSDTEESTSLSAL